MGFRASLWCVAAVSLALAGCDEAAVRSTPPAPPAVRSWADDVYDRLASLTRLGSLPNQISVSTPSAAPQDGLVGVVQAAVAPTTGTTSSIVAFRVWDFTPTAEWNHERTVAGLAPPQGQPKRTWYPRDVDASAFCRRDPSGTTCFARHSLVTVEVFERGWGPPSAVRLLQASLEELRRKTP